jgi:hypothetical protein
MSGPAVPDWRYAIEPEMDTASSAGSEEEGVGPVRGSVSTPATEQREGEKTRTGAVSRPAHASGASQLDTA